MWVNGMKFGTVSPGRYTGDDRYTGVAVGRRSTVLAILEWAVFADCVFQIAGLIRKIINAIIYFSGVV